MSIMSRRRRLLKNRIRFLKTGRTRAVLFSYTRTCRRFCLSATRPFCRFDRFRNRYLYGAAGRYREAEAAPAESDCVAREGIFAHRAKTNLPMCLRRCESSSLGRFAELFLTCRDLSAAEVPCKTAPFASFSGRAEKGGPARPERVPIFFSLVKAIKKESIIRNFYEIVLTQR